ncbi:MAG: uroporphyrinogen decarboxylase [Bacteroidia bacterium]
MNYRNDLILRAARGEKTERTPVWMMRQAGRILKEYREVRAQAGDFKTLVETPELAAEVTLQPVDILGVDAAIIFSDILVIPDAMGCTYEMVEARGPVFPQTIRSTSDLSRIHIADPAELQYVTDAIALTVKQLDGRVPLIGFAGAPFTIFAYMTEGKGSKTFSIAKKLLYSDPKFSHRLLGMITQSTIAYLKAQIAAGAAMVQIFDSWAGILSPEQYREFSGAYIREICAAITEVPVTVFAKGAWFAIEDFGNYPCRTVGLDWNTDPGWARARVGADKTLQGNLDPCQLYAAPELVAVATRRMLQQFNGGPHIANLGHGVYPDTPLEGVKAFIDTVKSSSNS